MDHVDGQLARLRGTASLDGVQLDYLMHHTINLLVPLGVGYGLAARLTQPGWLLAGVAWGVGLLLLGLQDDARYKAFILRLKRLRGQLVVEGGGGYQPLPQPPIPRRPLRLVRWLAHKGCETHVMMNVLLLLAAAAWFGSDTRLVAGRIYLAAMAGLAPLLAGWTVARSQRGGAVEAEFARWFHVPAGYAMVYDDGWWIVEAGENAVTERNAEYTRPAKLVLTKTPNFARTRAMLVHILILNYNGRRLLEQCLPSVVTATAGSRHQCTVGVVDNDSTDDSVAWLCPLARRVCGAAYQPGPVLL